MGLVKGTTTAEKDAVNSALPVDAEEAALPTKVNTEENGELPADTALQAISVLPRVEDDEGTGFNLLDGKLDFTSFPVAIINNGHLFLGSKQVPTLEGVIHSLSEITIFKASRDDKAPMFYSKNGSTDNNGIPLETYKDSWEAAGYPRTGTVKKVYLIGYAMQENGDMFAFNVPPASQGKLAGHRVNLQLRGLKLNNVLTKFATGEMVTTAEKKSFTPWQFSFVKKVS